jgi:hypothetical protein
MIREHTIHTRYNVYWMATFEGYDGAPDAHDIIGTGQTELGAIADLLDQERDQDDLRAATPRSAE